MNNLGYAGVQIFGELWPVIGAVIIVFLVILAISWFVLPFFVWGIYNKTKDQRDQLVQIKKLVAKQLANQLVTEQDQEELL